VLHQIFFELLDEKDKTVGTARHVADTFCALANELYLIYCFDKNPQSQVTLSDERWSKYFLGQGRDKSIGFLQSIKLIHCEDKADPNDPTMTEKWYEIDVDLLKKIRRETEE